MRGKNWLEFYGRNCQHCVCACWTCDVIDDWHDFFFFLQVGNLVWVRVCTCVNKCISMHQESLVCACACVSCLSARVIWVQKYEQRVKAQRSMMWSKACTYIIWTWAHVPARTVYYCNPSPGCKMQTTCNQLDNQCLSPTGSHAF